MPLTTIVAVTSAHCCSAITQTIRLGRLRRPQECPRRCFGNSSGRTRFGSPLVLSRVHWVESMLVAEITYPTRTATTCCGRRSMSGYARTNRPTKCGRDRQELREGLTTQAASDTARQCSK
jgi:hypothetical protein